LTNGWRDFAAVKQMQLLSATSFIQNLEFLADRSAHSMIGYWHYIVICQSVRQYVTLCIVPHRVSVGG